jgi:hypothetical protein
MGGGERLSRRVIELPLFYAKRSDQRRDITERYSPYFRSKSHTSSNRGPFAGKKAKGKPWVHCRDKIAIRGREEFPRDLSQV